MHVTGETAHKKKNKEVNRWKTSILELSQKPFLFRRWNKNKKIKTGNCSVPMLPRETEKQKKRRTKFVFLKRGEDDIEKKKETQIFFLIFFVRFLSSTKTKVPGKNWGRILIFSLICLKCFWKVNERGTSKSGILTWKVWKASRLSKKVFGQIWQSS